MYWKMVEDCPKTRKGRGNQCQENEYKVSIKGMCSALFEGQSSCMRDYIGNNEIPKKMWTKELKHAYFIFL